MTLTELIAATGGDEKLEIQFLDQCATDLNYSAKSGTKIMFGTEVPIDLNGTRKLGIVLWLDRDRVKAALAAPKVEQSS